MRIIERTNYPISRLFDDFLNRAVTPQHSENKMLIDILEDEKYFKIFGNLPGVKKEEVKISLEKNVLTIKTERKVEEEKNQIRLNERFNGNYIRSLYLPEEIDIQNINAKMENGVLTITIPKAEKPSKEIKIK